MVKIRSLEDVWNIKEKKLYVRLMEAKDLASKDSNGFSDPYVKLFYGMAGKQNCKSTIYKKTLNPVFGEKEVFFFEDDNSDFYIELWDHDTIGSDDFLGMVSWGKLLQSMKKETLVDDWFPLQARKGKKDTISGKIRLRLYYSVYPEHRPAKAIENAFFYDEPIKKFKTGDMIVFDGIGFLDTLQKLNTGSSNSRVGMVIRAPNKWTKKDEVYLVEISRNLDGFLDVYKEVPGFGVCIFRLEERLHQFHGNAIYYVPLKESLNAETENKVLEWIAQVHQGKQTFSKNKHPSAMIMAAIEDQEKSLIKADLSELFTGDFINDAYKQGGLQLFKDEQKTVYPDDLISCGKFDKPILIRCFQENAPPQPVKTEKPAEKPAEKSRTTSFHNYPTHRPITVDYSQPPQYPPINMPPSYEAPPNLSQYPPNMGQPPVPVPGPVMYPPPGSPFPGQMYPGSPVYPTHPSQYPPQPSQYPPQPYPHQTVRIQSVGVNEYQHPIMPPTPVQPPQQQSPVEETTKH